MTDDKKQIKRRRGDGRVAFLAYADDFRELLNAGHPQRAIFDDYMQRLGISYSQFNRYVGRYLLVGNDDGKQEYDTKREEQNQQAARPATKTSDKKTGFTHNASGGNDRDDLI